MLASRLFDYQNVEVLAKMTASSAFVLLALSFGAWANRYGRFILTGLVFSWIGDLLLTGTEESSFLLGLASFLMAHVAYISAFLSLGANKRWMLAAVAPVAMLSISVSFWLTPHLHDMVIPVRVYTAVISLMVVASIGARGAGFSMLIPVGALLFYFSDLSVAIGQFIETEFPHYFWGLPFYFAGQVLLAMSVRRSAVENEVPSK